MHGLTIYALLGGAVAAVLVWKADRPPAVRDAAWCGIGLLTFLAAGFGVDGGLLEAAEHRRLLAAPLTAAAAFAASKTWRDGRPRAAGLLAGAAAAFAALAALPVDRGGGETWAGDVLLPVTVLLVLAAGFADRPRPGEEVRR